MRVGICTELLALADQLLHNCVVCKFDNKSGGGEEVDDLNDEKNRNAIIRELLVCVHVFLYSKCIRMYWDLHSLHANVNILYICKYMHQVTIFTYTNIGGGH